MSEKIVEKGLTKKALAYGVVITIAVTMVLTVTEWYISPEIGSRYQGVEPAQAQLPWLWFAGFTVLLVVLNAIMPDSIRLNMSELMVVWTMMIMCLGLMEGSGMKQSPLFSLQGYYTLEIGSPHQYPEGMIKWATPWLYNPLWGTPLPTKMWFDWPTGPTGRPKGVTMPIAWELFLPQMSYFIARFLVLGLLFAFVAALSRKQYVDIESLQFPNANIGSALVKSESGGSGSLKERLPQIYKSKWFLMGIILSQLLLIPAYGWWAAKLTGGNTSVWANMALLQGNIKIPMIPIAIAWCAPAYYGVFMFAPLDFLMSVMVFWFICQVLFVNLAVGSGLIAPITDIRYYRYWRAAFWSSGGIRVQLGQSENFGTITFGVLVGAVIWPLWVHRKHVWATIKSLWAKQAPELDKGEPLSYKQLWIGTIIVFVAYIALYAATPAVLWIGIIFTILFVVWHLGGSRYVAETGGLGGHWTAGPSWNGNFVYWGPRVALLGSVGPVTADCSFVNGQHHYTMMMADANAAPYSYATATSSPMPFLLECFKVGSVTKTSSKDIFIAALISIPLTLIVGNIWGIVCQYQFPWWNNWFLGTTDQEQFGNRIASKGTPLGWRGYWYYGYLDQYPNVGVILSLIAVGALIYIACYAIKTRYPRFFLDPMAMVLLANPPFWTLLYGGELWWSVLVTLVVKFVVMKFLGLEHYEKKLKPIAIGLIVGTFIWLVIDRAITIGPGYTY